MLVDIHAKSAVSPEVPLTLPDVISRTKKSGLDGLAICETLSTSLCKEAIALGREHDITVFVGVEIPTDKGRLLGFVPEIDGFYLTEEWRRVADVKAPPAEAVLDLFESRGGATIAARPYDLSIPFNMGDYVLTFDEIAAVEVFNSKVTATQQNFAMEAASFMDLSTVGGTDPGQSAEAIGEYATFFEEEITSQRDFVEALRTADYWAVKLGQG